jgi:hypothetical protein
MENYNFEKGIFYMHDLDDAVDKHHTYVNIYLIDTH